MFSWIRAHLLRLLRVPHDPEPPAGAPGSVRIFRGGRNLYHLRLLRWTLGQAGALAGIVFSVVFLDRLEVSHAAEKARLKERAQVEAAATTSRTPAASAPTGDSGAQVQPAPAGSTAAKTKPTSASRKRARDSLSRVVERWPWWVFPLLNLIEFAGILTYLVQIPVTYAMVRLDFELRWYMVTDRSLRIRAGLVTVQESTMSFANVQQVLVTQGPVQRLLGIADVRVQSAGGGGDAHEKDAGDSLHTGVFHGVENAGEIRDLILDRLRRFRESGLGDPDESANRTQSASPPIPRSGATLAAARELLAEARALRHQLNVAAAR